MFKIVIEKNTIQMGNHNVIASFWIECNGLSFPEKNWSDFVLPVMLWWSETAVSIAQRRNEKYRLLFMDGPFEMIIKSRSSSEQLDISFEERIEQNQKVIRKEGIDRSTFIDEIKACNLILIDRLRELDAHGTKDYARLVSINEQLLLS